MPYILAAQAGFAAAGASARDHPPSPHSREPLPLTLLAVNLSLALCIFVSSAVKSLRQVAYSPNSTRHAESSPNACASSA